MPTRLAHAAALAGVLLVVGNGVAHAGRGAKARPKDAITLGPFGWENQLDAVSFTVTRGVRLMRVVVALTVSSTKDTDLLLRRPLKLELPARGRFVGLATTVGTRPRLVAATEVDGEAWDRFRVHASADRDAALGLFRYAVDGRAHYDVHVSRLTVGAPARVELELELPLVSTLVIESRSAMKDATLIVDGAATTSVAIAGDYKATRLELPRRAGVAATEITPATELLTDGVSLLGEPVLPPQVDDVIVRETRTQARASIEALYACFPSTRILWNVELELTVTAQGRASDVKLVKTYVELPGPDTDFCLAGELSAWRFTPPSVPTTVRYRLHVARFRN